MKTMINITVISQDNRSIELIKIDSYQSITSNFTNETINLPYDNYLLKITDMNSNFSMNNFFNIVDNKIMNDIIFIVFIFIILIAISIFIQHMKKW